MIRAVLVDDEIDSIRVLTTLLHNCCPEVEIIGQADGVDSAMNIIRELEPDLVFLDIEMTRGNAFDLLNCLMPIDFQVIFVTAFDNYAIRAFKYSAVDYLLKPVDIEDLRHAVDRVAKPVDKTIDGQMQMLLDNINMLRSSSQKMAIPTTAGLEFIMMKDIVHLEAKGSYTVIHLNEKTPVLTSRNIKEYEGMLPARQFFRVHSSSIINMDRIQKYQKGRGGYVVMDDGTSIEVASRRRNEFLERLMQWPGV